MGIFSRPKTTYVTQQTEKATEEKEDTRATKQRLIETKGEHKGQLLNENQGKSARKIFG